MRSIFFVMILCLLVGCTKRPVYKTVEEIPEDAKSCVADARQLKIDCKESKLHLYEQCMLREQTMYNDALNTYNLNKTSLRGELQTCMTICLEKTHPYTDSKGNTVDKKNTAESCRSTYRSSDYDFRGTPGECAHLQEELNNMREPSSPSCEHIYSPCNAQYKLDFERCGASRKKVCVQNCEEQK